MIDGYSLEESANEMAEKAEFKTSNFQLQPSLIAKSITVPMQGTRGRK